MRRFWFVLIVMCLAVSVASAQTKISGTIQCPKASVEHVIQVGDKPGHAYVIEQGSCTWTKPMTIEGVENKVGGLTQFNEVNGNKAKFHGQYSDTMVNGDKAEYTYAGTATMKDGMIVSAEDKWSLVSGTGKLKGMKSHGTCTGKGGADGSATWECSGEYTAAKQTK